MAICNSYQRLDELLSRLLNGNYSQEDKKVYLRADFDPELIGASHDVQSKQFWQIKAEIALLTYHVDEFASPFVQIDYLTVTCNSPRILVAGVQVLDAYMDLSLSKNEYDLITRAYQQVLDQIAVVPLPQRYINRICAIVCKRKNVLVLPRKL